MEEFDKNLPFDYFLIERIPVLDRLNKNKNKNSKNKNYKYVEKYKAISEIGFNPRKPISKLLDPNDF